MSCLKALRSRRTAVALSVMMLFALVLLPVAGNAERNSYFSVKGDDSVFLTAVKKAEDTNALVLRFYEWAGKDGQVSLTFPKGATSATATNLMEKPEGQPLQLVDSDSVTVPVDHYSINTVEVAYPHDQR
jgi:alpha-mannosidase